MSPVGVAKGTSPSQRRVECHASPASWPWPIRFDDPIKAGGIADYSELAQLGHVTRARITQIMNLLHLAPDIQEQVLFLPPTKHGRDPIHLARLQPIATTLDWSQQRRLWAALVRNLMEHFTLEEPLPAHLSAGRA